MDTLLNFNISCRKGELVSEDDLIIICSLLSGGIDAQALQHESLIETVENLSYRSLDESEIGEMIVQTLKIMINDPQLNIIDDFISKLIPMLPRIQRKSNTSGVAGLNPQVGMSLKEDDARRTWKASGGMRSIPLMYVVLLGLKHNRLSSNLWWITPGILNILDDTTDLAGVRLKGVLLIKTLLEECFEDDEHWISFHDTGLYSLYEPIIFNMCYCLPPGYSSTDSLAIWRIVFPTLNLLYRLQFKNNEAAYKHHLGNFLSQLLLQNLIVRINITDEHLTLFGLRALSIMVRTLQVTVVSHLQRIIYTLGEYLVRNAFYSAFPSLVFGTIDVLFAIVEVCPTERLLAHKYDLFALILITFEKCQNEGKLTDKLELRLKKLIRMLESKGCDLTDEKSEILKTKNMSKILT